MTTKDGQIQSLKYLGFTATEANVYLFLLHEPNVSGYRISQALGSPPSQIYKAVESLEQKGAVVTDDGKTKQCRAVELQTLIKQMQSRFTQQAENAKNQLKDIDHSPADDRIYQLKNVDQAYARAKTMIEQAQRVIMVDMFPGPASKMADAITAAAKRGVKVCARLYQPIEMDADLMFEPEQSELILDKTDGQHLSLAVDCKELLSVLFGQDADSKSGITSCIKNGIWSKNSYLCSVQHNSIASEVYFLTVRQHIEHGDDNQALRELLERLEQFDTVHWR